MIDLEKAQNEFMNYTSTYNTEKYKIKLKVNHSLRVMECSKKIAENINLQGDEKDLAILIGLLHDIARFEQMKRYNTYIDAISIDHGDLAVEILEENNFLRKFIETDKYDNIIKTAIKNHNKWKIEDGLDEKTLLQAKIIRDADKLDIFYEGKEMFWHDEKEIEEINNSKLSDSVYNEIIDKTQVKRQKNHTPVDRLACFMSFIYDINFKYSYKSILENDYINNILNRFNFEDEKTKNNFETIKKEAYIYLENKIK